MFIDKKRLRNSVTLKWFTVDKNLCQMSKQFLYVVDVWDVYVFVIVV